LPIPLALPFETALTLEFIASRFRRAARPGSPESSEHCRSRIGRR